LSISKSFINPTKIIQISSENRGEIITTFIKPKLSIILQMKTLEIISKASINDFGARMSTKFNVWCDDDQLQVI